VSEFPDAAARALIALARRSIEQALAGAAPPTPQAPPPELERPGGAFVTLETGGRLRGCIGRVESSEPVWRTVVDMARAAAFEDPRFPPLSAEELSRVRIEISVLSPLALLSDPAAEVRVGTHGLIVQRGASRGLLLPQVASRRGWDAVTFLEETCVKAGLPANAWRESGARVWAFRADVFGEGSS